jgi:hypothetical protein
MISLELDGYDALRGELEEYPRRAQRTLIRGLNRGIGAARTFLVKEIARDTGLKSGDVRSKLFLREATASLPVASLAASKKRLPLILFGARGPEPSRGKGRGVSYRLPGGRGRAPHAFLATMRSGHRGVFARVARGRLPIRELRGPSLGRVFAKFRPDAIARANAVVLSTLQHEIARVQARSARVAAD